MEKENINIKNGHNIDASSGFFALALVFLFCWDTPKGDLLDALVLYLLK